MWRPNVSDWCDNGFHSRLSLSEFQAEIIGIVNTLMIPITLLANTVLLLSLVKTKQLRSVSNTFMCALCIVDSCIGAIVQVIVSLLFTVYKSSPVCKFEVAGTFLTFFFGHFSGFIIVAISIDRAIHMTYLYKYNSIMTHLRAKIMIMICFIIALTFAAGYVLSSWYRVYAYVHSAILLADALAVSIIFVSYMRMFFRVKKHIQQSAGIRGGTPEIKRKYDASENKQKPQYALAMAKTIFCILAAVFVAYIPYVLVNLARNYVAAIQKVEPSRHLEFGMYFTYLLVYLNSSLNAFIFIFGNPKCKKWVMQPLLNFGLFPNAKRFELPIPDTNTTSVV